MRFTHDGTPVNCTEVPETATAVPDVITLDAIELRTAPEIDGEVPNTFAPEPVEVVTPVPPLATGRVPVTLVVKFAKVVDVVPVPPEATGKAFANETTWAELIVTAVVGVAPVWRTSAPVVSASTEYAVVNVVDDLIVLI